MNIFINWTVNIHDRKNTLLWLYKGLSVSDLHLRILNLETPLLISIWSLHVLVFIYLFIHVKSSSRPFLCFLFYFTSFWLGWIKYCNFSEVKEGSRTFYIVKPTLGSSDTTFKRYNTLLNKFFVLYTIAPIQVLRLL